MPIVYKPFVVAFFVTVLAIAAGDGQAQQPPPAASPAVPVVALQPLTVTTRSGQFTFRVEFARTLEERMTGLMYRTSLEPDRGMLFDFNSDQTVHMWMKNTLIPLDMLFLDARGSVVAVEAQAQPGDLTPRGPDQPVRAVLEVRGGTAALLGIRPGDRVSHPMFPVR